MDLRELGWGGTNWINLSQDRDQWRAVGNTVMNLRVAYNIGQFLTSSATDGFSRTPHHGFN
jgi:hypothetical protein